MRQLLVSITLFYLIISAPLVNAIYNPLSVTNNRVGVHILDPSEIFQASQLVNSNGGDWGYVLIPMRSNDRDFYKWNDFFIQAGKLHLIPIIRLATYPSDNLWVEPTEMDLADFAAFLNLFPWPIQNRYVVIFNEPNHAKEWGGRVDPEQYVRLSQYAHEVFKKTHPDFFLISAGMDMSAPTNHSSIDALQYYRRMFAIDANWPELFDGIGFHPYPNPAFSASVYTSNRYGIRSFEYELNLFKRYGYTPKYLFFTETGTIKSSGFYTTAFTSIWRDNRITAITPFVLYAGTGEFSKFSLLNPDHTQTNNYRELKNLPKQIGQPQIATHSSKPNPYSTSSAPAPRQNQVKPIWQKLIDYLIANL